MVLGFGKKAKSAPLRDNNPKNKKNVTIKKAKYPLFKGYNPPGGPGRGTFHKKTEREKRLNKAWEILNPPGYGEGPEYKGKIQNRVDELNAIPSKSEIDRIELAYLKDLQKDNFMDKESFKWANYIGPEAKNEWKAAAEAEWNRTFPAVSDPLPPPPSTPPPTAVTTAATTAAPPPPTSNPNAATTAATTAVTAAPPAPAPAPAPTALTSFLPRPPKNYFNRKEELTKQRNAALSQKSTTPNTVKTNAALSQGSTPTTPSDPTPPVLTQSTVSNAGDPTNINSTIKRMKCIVCNSQFIIYDGLGKKGEAPKCSKCNSSSSINMNLIPGANNDKTAASNNNINKGTAYFPPPRKGAKTKAAETSINMNLIPGANNYKTAASNNNINKGTAYFPPPRKGAKTKAAETSTNTKKTTGGKRSTRKQRKNKKRASRRR